MRQQFLGEAGTLVVAAMVTNKVALCENIEISTNYLKKIMTIYTYATVHKN